MGRIFTDVRRVLIRRGATTEFRNEQHGLNKSRHCFVLFWSDLGNGLESIQAKRHPTVRSISPHLQLLFAIYLYSKAVHNRSFPFFKHHQWLYWKDSSLWRMQNYALQIRSWLLFLVFIELYRCYSNRGSCYYAMNTILKNDSSLLTVYSLF